MNKDRRKEIARALALIEEAKAIVEGCREEEQDYRDNMPESIGAGDKGTKADEAVTSLDDAIEMLDSAVEFLSGIE